MKVNNFGVSSANEHGVLASQMATTPLAEVVGAQKLIDPELFELARLLDK